MRNWSKSSLGELTNKGNGVIQTGPFGSQLHVSDYVNEGIPIIMPVNLKGNRIDISKVSFISESDANRLAKHIVKSGDIIYSRRGDVTQKSLITEKEEGYFCGTGCLLIRVGNIIDPNFLVYFLSTPSSKYWITSNAVGITMPNLNTKILSRFPISYPEPKKQKQLVKILLNLDEKIELNNNINAELEAMAKLIYDYWFVQFDYPDKEGKPYKSSGGKMVFNEELKREIPEGWESENLNSLLEFKKGVEPGSKAYVDRKVNGSFIKFFRVSNINGNSDTYIDSSKKVYKYAKEGDVVVTFDGSVGKVGIGINGAYSSGLRKVFSPTKVLKNSLVYLIFKDQRIIKTIHKYSTGSIILHASKSIDHLRIPYKKSVYDEFQDITEPLYGKIVSNIKQNQKLAELREWLLPMLMNGQVKVGE